MWNKHQEGTGMKEEGLWRLFFLTGLPEVYLALKTGEGELPKTEESAVTAFLPQSDRTAQC